MKIGVVGSINVDMVYALPKFLKPGETLIGSDFRLLMGGKGANQAVMASAMSDNVVFLGAVGNDSFAEAAIDNLKAKGVGIDHISKKNTSTGLAVIQLVKGENSIAVIPGANMAIETTEIDHFLNSNPDLGLVVSQLEINLDAIEYLVKQCNLRKIPIILNPAPAQPLTDEMIARVDYLIPNETETELLFHSADYASLVQQYGGKLLITMGAQGVMYYNGDRAVISPAPTIEVVDTTGAGDSFVAGFAVGIAHQLGLTAAIELGIQTATQTCITLGAQGAYESVKEKHYEKIRNSK